MSHFAVLVTNTDKVSLDEQLAPFDENTNVPEYRRYLDEDDIKSMREYYSKKNPDTDYSTLESLVPRLDDWCGGEGGVDEKGLYYLSQYNPDSKWDWYAVGGRWAGFFKGKPGAEGKFEGQAYYIDEAEKKADKALKDSGHFDVIKVKDIDWEAMKQEQIKARGEYWDKQQEEPVEKRWAWRNNRDELLLMSRSQYANDISAISTFGVLHDGTWYERGSMGWWAIVSDEKPEEEWDAEWQKLVDSLDPESEVTLVDCHI